MMSKARVYEDVFDSYSMDLNTFKRQLQARLSEYNDNEEGYVYYIGSDARRYYQATDAAKLTLEGIQVHAEGVEDILIHLFHVVPALGNVYLVGVGLLGLLAATADDVRRHPIVHRIGEAVALGVELLHTAAAPSGMVLRVGQYLLSLRAVRVEVGVGGV